jgi:hypothetical protein
MSEVTQLWMAVFFLFLTHQTEEVFYSIGKWHAAHEKPAWTKFVSHSLMVTMDTWAKRAMLVAAQCTGLLVVAFLASGSLLATRIIITAFLSIMMAAFTMHITLSIATRSAMPGLSTSIFPGLPVSLLLIYLTWHI